MVGAEELWGSQADNGGGAGQNSHWLTGSAGSPGAGLILLCREMWDEVPLMRVLFSCVCE